MPHRTSGLEIAAQHFAEIGRMVVAFQSLEATVKRYLELMLHVRSNPGAAYLARAMIDDMSFSSLMRNAAAIPKAFTAEMLAPTTHPEHTERATAYADAVSQIAEGIRKAQSVEQRRNQLIHSEWTVIPGASGPSDAIYRLKAKKRGETELRMSPETPATIAKVADEAHEAQALLVNGLRTLFRLTPEQQDTTSAT